ncbi:NACHT and WD domain protein [Apiospora arundinis]
MSPQVSSHGCLYTPLAHVSSCRRLVLLSLNLETVQYSCLGVNMDGQGRTSSEKGSRRSASVRSSGSSLSKRLSSFLSIGRKQSESLTKAVKVKNEFGLITVYRPSSASSVIADFIFVHGLGGGSSTTWCLKQNPEFFWPKEWLPKDSSFEAVRIHSFGYNANWATWLSSPLDVHAFGQSLLEELLNNPEIRASSTPIVLIGHSMGGLVIKKVCILSKTNPGFACVAERLHSFYFLGTPHRGSNLARTLNNILRVSGVGRRAYVAGLETKSELIRVLSDEFRIHYSGIHLHTFYETQPTPPVGLIVDIESATLGYAEERPQLMNACHRDLAKFESDQDSNYRSLRNRLAATVLQIMTEISHPPVPLLEHEALTSGTSTSQPSPMEQMDAIGLYLGIDRTTVDEDKESLDVTRQQGSCAWLTAKPSFQEWRYSPVPLRPAFIFFKAADKTAPSLGAFLCSMAYQMAKTNTEIRKSIFQLSQQASPVDARNPKSIWHNVFTSCVFHTKLPKPHFWIIDALDEAAERGSLDEYFSFMSRIDVNIPLKVFITSRLSHVLDNLFTQLPTLTYFVTPDDSIADIELYVSSRSANLPVTDSLERNELARNIVSMSGGSFLWVVLVMEQLGDAHTVEDVQDVLHEVPKEMSELYHRNLLKVESSRSKNLAKHIITWAVCSVLRLTVDQMKDAVKLSLGTTLARDLHTNLQYLCGQFLNIDKQARVHVVHETARAFLTSKSLDSELRIDVQEGNRLISLACLKFLLSDELNHPRRRRTSTAITTSRTPMADYACLWFSEHVSQSSSADNTLFDMLSKFFSTNVLSWIESVAQLRDLRCLIRTSRNLSNYLNRRVKYTPMVPPDLSAWAVDLPRIVTQFGANLLSDPSAIHTLVPPLCPRNSVIYRNFGYVEDGIKLVGAWSSDWDDRICSISYNETYATAIATQDQYFAVGLADGTVKIYSTATCEEIVSFTHEESISILEFGPTSKHVVSAGLHHFSLWESATGTRLFQVVTDAQTLAVSFDADETKIMVASRDKILSAWKISDASRLYELPWHDNFVVDKDSGYSPSPSAVTISTEHQVMAVIYRSRPVQLWSLESQRSLGACIRPSTNKHSQAGHIVNSAVFNPVLSYPRILVSYWDDIVAVFDLNTCKPLAWITADITKLAISPNGKTFAGSDGSGGIKIFDFDTLQFLHKVSIRDEPVTSLTFTGDSLRIADVRGTQANVWEPPVLVSQDSDSHSSEPSYSVRQVLEDTGDSGLDQAEAIVSLQCCEESGIAFCGRSNGHVDICNLDDPEKTMRNLYKHRGSFTSVTCIDWNHEARVAASADSSGHFRIMRITTGARREWSAQMVLENRLPQGCTITQVLLHPEGTFVLVSSPNFDTVWSISTKERVAHIEGRQRSAWKWFIRPKMPSQLLLFEDKILRLFTWSDLVQITALEDAKTLPNHDGNNPCDSEGGDADVDAVSIASEGDDMVFIEKTQLRSHCLPTLAPQTASTKVQVFDLSSLEHYDIQAVAAASPGHSGQLSLETNSSPLPAPNSRSGSLFTTSPPFLPFRSN